MNPNLARWIRMVLSSIIKGSLASATALMTALTQLKPGDEVTSMGWVLILVGGVVIALGDAQSYLSQPPASLGGVPLPDIVVPPHG